MDQDKITTYLDSNEVLIGAIDNFFTNADNLDRAHVIKFIYSVSDHSSTLKYSKTCISH